MKNYKFSDGSKVFFTSDSHFYHLNIIKYCNRPFNSVEQMNDVLICNWNSIVGNDDYIFHLGDIGFCGNDRLIPILKQLNGHKILIKGNHDIRIQDSVISKFFEHCTQQMIITINKKSILLNHYPVLCFLQDYQLFGHIHSNLYSTSNDTERFKLYGLNNQYDVGVDNNNYKPISWDKIKEKLDYGNN